MAGELYIASLVRDLLISAEAYKWIMLFGYLLSLDMHVFTSIGSILNVHWFIEVYSSCLFIQ